MRAGKLRHRINLLKKTSHLDPAGQEVGDWEVVAENLPASILFKSGSESRRGEQTESVATHEIRMRYHEGVNAKMRVQHLIHGEVKHYEIESVGDPMGRSRELLLMCKEADGGK